MFRFLYKAPFVKPFPTFNLLKQMFMDALDVDDVIAHLLVAEGFVDIEQVAFVPVEELGNIEGFDEEVAEELRARARQHLERVEGVADLFMVLLDREKAFIGPGEPEGLALAVPAHDEVVRPSREGRAHVYRRRQQRSSKTQY